MAERIEKIEFSDTIVYKYRVGNDLEPFSMSDMRGINLTIGGLI
jgi:hypothetical protein